jgi:hypothetical protein
LNLLDADDWKRIVSHNVVVNPNIWENLMEWIKVEKSDREKQLPTILSAASGLPWFQLTENPLKNFRIRKRVHCVSGATSCNGRL